MALRIVICMAVVMIVDPLDAIQVVVYGDVGVAVDQKVVVGHLVVLRMDARVDVHLLIVEVLAVKMDLVVPRKATTTTKTRMRMRTANQISLPELDCAQTEISQCKF